MAVPTRSVGSLVVEVVITSQLSRAIALGKRKASVAFASSSKAASLCGYATSSEATEDGDDDLDSDFAEGEDADGDDEVLDDSGSVESIENGFRPPGSETPTKRLYRCTHQGCMKSYRKPSRLAEHERSHTGEVCRPYICSTCNKSYIRKSHLIAHVRSHLTASDRPLACPESPCPKRFWTSQHLNVHLTRVHNGEKPFKCDQDGCDHRFAKHNQLKRHVADVHCPSGTKPCQCPAPGCSRSFATNQHLRGHSKVHEANRYACVNDTCRTTLAPGTSSPLYFANWTALQAHNREHHPPTCPYAECEGRIFPSNNGLKEHLKMHEQRDTEDALETAVAEDDRPKKRRRGGEVGRDWVCEVDGCVKAFKSASTSLKNHNNITHLGRRDHICLYPACGQTFGYKHLLQRHTAKNHRAKERPVNAAPASSEGEGESSSIIGWITGTNYVSPSAHHNTRRALVPCPWPDRFESEDLNGDKPTPAQAGLGQCAFMFSRAYDLRRHLKSDHGLELTKDETDEWVRNWREQHSDTI
ncbi:hypothetical protein JB92DRAFT_2758971 [Gautieria morchelliformis]|nr:hypothetical protein JB92DRAFT_2758971 [Gautieria morchelliformis]